MADEDNTPDLSFIPDTFKGEDGAYKLDEFAAHVEGLSTFKADTEAARAALPQNADGYSWGVAEDYAFPEGFDPSAFKQPVLGDDGKAKIGADGQPETRDLSPADLLSADDEDLPALRELMHSHGVKPEVMTGLAGILVGRELRQMQAAGDAAAEQKKLLGPDADNRISVVTRSVEAQLPAAEAKAVLDSITSADALRAIEKLVGGKVRPPAPAPGNKPDLESMSAKEMIQLGLQQQAKG